jgi:hypothetical protein
MAKRKVEKPARPEIHMYSIPELDAVAQRQETEPWPANEALYAVEHAFRVGYRHGWQEAIDAMYELMFAKHLPREDAYRILWNNWEGALTQWEQDGRYTVLGHGLLTSIHRDAPASAGGDWPPQPKVPEK